MRSFAGTILFVMASIFCLSPAYAGEIPILTDLSGNRISLVQNSSIIDPPNDIMNVMVRVDLADASREAVREHLLLTAAGRSEGELADRVSHISLRIAFRLSTPMARTTETVFYTCDDLEIRKTRHPLAHADWEYARGDLLRLALKLKQVLRVRQPFTYDNNYVRGSVRGAGDRLITYYIISSQGDRYCSTPGFTVIHKPDFLTATQFFGLLSPKDGSLLASCAKGDSASCRVYEQKHHAFKTMDAPTRCLFKNVEYRAPQGPQKQGEFSGRGGCVVADLPARVRHIN